MKPEQKIGGYRILSPLGAGGMGEVWRAEDLKLGREVALKMLPAEFAGDPERMARFEREAKVLASLNHPNIATLFGLETAPPCHPERSDLRGREVEGSPEAQSDAERNTPYQPSGDPLTRSSDSLAQGDSDGGRSTHSSTPQPLNPSAPVTFLVMELVEGEDLSERISRGPIPIDEAVNIARQIAEGLEAAHEQGIVHRDLKPANIKLKADGSVKVLDFGLAKAWETENTDSSLSLSPTMTQHATAAGLILGTAAYMSPEQAAGTAADRRADIWAFGVVLWEMLTGHKLFEGETVSHVLASVLKDEVELDELPKTTPLRLRELIERCLQRKPRQRLQAIGDARIVLEGPLEGPGQKASAQAQALVTEASLPRWRRLMPWAAVAVLALALAAGVWWALAQRPQVIAATIAPPPETDFYLDPSSPGPAAVSPDGKNIAYSARDEEGEILLYLRRLDAPQAQALSDTRNAAYPFWSPDSRWIGFFNRSDGTLKKIDSRGGPPITLCSAPNGKGGTWNENGMIVFAPDAGGSLQIVSSAGGDPTQLTELDVDRHNSHRHPRFLPDGRHAMFVARGVTPADGELLVVDIEDGTETQIMAAGTQAEFGSGHLLFVREQALMARSFDANKLEFTGEAVPVAEGVLIVPGASLAAFSVSGTGVLSYASGEAELKIELEWRDRSGEVEGRLGDPTSYRAVRISPDDRLAAARVVDTALGTEDLWIFDLDRGLRSRFTFDPGMDIWPVWSPDSRSVYFFSDREGTNGIYRKDLAGAGNVELVYAGEQAMWPSSISPDGSVLLLSSPGSGTGNDISVIDLDQPSEWLPFRHTEFQEAAGVFSPDGRWVAYHSNESGEYEVYVTPYPGPGRRWQVSSESGTYPVWRADGREIIYSRLNGELVAAKVRADGESFQVEGEGVLFAIQSVESGGAYFSVSSDAQRVLVVPSSAQRADSLLHLLVNWPTAMEARR